MPIRSVTIEDLPCELMLNIFEYLSVSDRNICALTSIYWYEIINHLNYLLNDSTLVFDENVTIDENQQPVATLMKRYKKIRSLKLMKQVRFGFGCEHFWVSLESTLTEIEFVHCEYLTNEILIGILKVLKKLKVLKLYAPLFRRWELFQKNRFLINDSNRNDLKETLESITHLTLCDSKINDTHFTNLLQNLPNLCSFDATSLYFRRGSDDETLNQLSSNSFLTWIESNEAANLKDLRLKNVDNELLDGMSRIPQLKLKSCSLQLCQIHVKTLYMFIQNQHALEQLNIDLSNCPRPENLIMYLQTVPYLTELKLGIGFTTSNFATFQKFSNLRKLSMHLAPTSLPSDGSEFYIKTGQNPKLRELEIISCIPYAPGSLKAFTRMINNYKKLTVLTISGIMLSDKELQSIFRIMERLVELTITNCEKITDKGITGYSGKSTFKMYSLENLKGLKKLTLSNSHQISDKSVKESFILSELQYLALNGAIQITEDGVAGLACTVPAMEEIVWTSQKFIDKSWIEEFKGKFRRLQSVSINVSSMNLNAIVDSIEPNGNICFPFDR